MFFKAFRKFKTSLLKEKGQVAVIVALLMVAMIGLLAYVIDEGSIYESRRSLQTVADSAVLAGAQELPERPAEAIQKAIDYASMHEVSSDDLTVQIDDTYVLNDTISVIAADMDKELFFAGIFGENTTPVGADATAIIGSPSELNNVVPFGILEDDWVPGQEYTLKWGPPGNTGNFGPLALGGTGANNYRENVREGYDGSLQVGDVVETEPGNMKSPTLQGTSERIYNYHDYNFNTFGELTAHEDGVYKLKDSTDSQFVMCPLIDWIPDGRDEVTILAFVPFIITEVSGSEVHGTFINEALIVTDGEISAVDSHGIRVIRLIE